MDPDFPNLDCSDCEDDEEVDCWDCMQDFVDEYNKDFSDDQIELLRNGSPFTEFHINLRRKEDD